MFTNKKFAGFGLLIALMMSLTLVFAACGDVTSTPGAATVGATASSVQVKTLASQNVATGVSSPLAVSFPSTTQIYFTLNTDSNSDQVGSFQKVVAYLDAIPEVKKVFDNTDIFKSLSAGSYDSSVKPWIGKELGIGVTDVNALVNLVGKASSMLGAVKKGDAAAPTATVTATAEANGSSNANPLQLLSALQNLPLIIGADVTNRAPAEAFASTLLSKLGNATKITYNGATLYTVAGFVPLTIGVSDSKFIVASSDSVVKAALDRTAGQGLDGNANFKQVESNLPSSNLGFAYLDSQSVIKAVLNNPMVQQQLNKANNGSNPNILANSQYADSMGLTFSTTSEGILVDSYSLLSKNLPANVQAMLNRKANPSTILKALPANTFGFANGQNGSDSYNSFISTIGSMGSQGQKILDGIKSFEQGSGLSLQNDVAPLFASETAFFVNSQSQANHPKDLPIGLGLVSAVTDKTAAQASLDKITAAIEKAASSSSPSLKFESRTSNGVTYKTAGVPNTSSTYLSLGIAGNYVFLSIDNQAANPVITSAMGGANFTNGPNAATFTTTQNSLVTNNQGYFYLDIQQALGLVNALPASQQSQVKAYTDKLAQLKAIGAATHYSTTDTTSSLFLYFPVTK